MMEKRTKITINKTQFMTVCGELNSIILLFSGIHALADDLII